MLRIFFSYLPFVVCLGWFVAFALRYAKNDSAKRVFTVFLATCVLLYYCHSQFFTSGLSVPMECLWMLCSLSVYPLYYIYIRVLISHPTRPAYSIGLLLPGAVIAASGLMWHREADVARMALNALQIPLVCYFGYRRLKHFDQQLAEVYVDTEGRDTHTMRHLLVAFLGISLLSGLANAIGKQYVGANDWVLSIGLTLFAVLLFALSYLGYHRDFTWEQFEADATDTVEERPNQEETVEANDTEINPELLQAIRQLMEEQKFYLNRNLKIGDVAFQLKSCRTYISRSINQNYNCSFSDYVNRLRITHAQRLLLAQPDAKILWVIEQSGFSNEQSFYRNFRKFVGVNPKEWLQSLRNTSDPFTEKSVC